MWLEGAHFRDQAGANTLGLNKCRQLAGGFGAIAQLEPDHAYEATPFECSDVTELKRERDQRLLGQPFGDTFGNRCRDVAQEADGQMKVRSRRPAKFWRLLCTVREIGLKLQALRLGHREPEERPDAQCVFFTQLAAAQWLGEVGRQP